MPLHIGVRFLKRASFAERCCFRNLASISGMPSRRRVKQTETLESRLLTEAQRRRTEADGLPPGPERDLAILKARQAESAANMSEALRPPARQL